MWWRRIGVAAGVAMGAIPASAQACPMHIPLDLADVRQADAVVVGRVTGYRIVLDQEARRERREQLRDPNFGGAFRDSLERQTGFLGDHARFEVAVDKVLAGQAPGRIRVAWDNSTFAEPRRMPPGPYLIALVAPRPSDPAGRDAPVYRLLQQPCSGAFLLKEDSAQAEAVRRVLAGQPAAPPPGAEVPAPGEPPAEPAPALPADPAAQPPLHRRLAPGHWAALVLVVLTLIAAFALPSRGGRRPPEADEDITGPRDG